MADRTVRNEVLFRVYIVLFLVLLAAVAIFGKAVQIYLAEGKTLQAQGRANFKLRPVEAERGNILTEDGAVIATSVPVYDIAFDPNADGLKEEIFAANIDSLAFCLATFVDQSFTPGGFKEYIIQKRQEKRRYILLKKQASFADKELIRQFPIFRLGQFRGGFIAAPQYIRERPFDILARRTIGYIREGVPPVGLEGYYDKDLKGQSGERQMMLVDTKQQLWIPINDFETIEPKRGDDIVTTINIDLQATTESALLRAMNHHNAEWGTAIVMEVKTGKIRAIANLGKTNEGWWETYNYGVGQSIEPGSTFKLASMMAMLEDGLIDLDDTIFINKGKTSYYNQTMEDAYEHDLDSTSIRHAFEMSSNVGISSLIHKHYNQTADAKGNAVKRAGAFIEQLRAFKLHLPTGVDLEGEPEPFIKEAYSTTDNWSGTTLPWMSIGYEMTLTPLQILTFYNAVANDGVMMKPFVVSAINHLGEEKRLIAPVVIDKSLASRSTIRQAKELLEGVVEHGTASKLKTSLYRFAGKTGTAQIGYQRLSDKTAIKGYQASFVGYFPAEEPIYSCIVVVNRPQQNGFYGADVAGPVFREIADKSFANDIELHVSFNENTEQKTRKSPHLSVGERKDMGYLLKHFDLKFYGGTTSEWASLRVDDGDSLKVLTRKMVKNEVPNVVGLGLKDAVFALESRGLKVQVVGVGKVREQSIKSGIRAKGQTVRIELN